MDMNIYIYIHKGEINKRTDKNEYITINADHFPLEEEYNYLNTICIISKSSLQYDNKNIYNFIRNEICRIMT